MGSRKENLKKSLGISEYPWSSDDDDNSTSQPVSVPRRQSDEGRPSVADAPGTSSGNGGNSGNSANTSTQGAQQSQSAPASVRKQAKMDRALFWSIISSTSRPPVGVTRICDVPVSYVARAESPTAEGRPEGRAEGRSESNEPRRHERTSADIQRLLAFKRLTRNLNNRNRQNNNSVLQMNPRRSVTSVGTRSSLFSPDLAIAAAARAAAVATVASVARGARGPTCCSRPQSIRCFSSGQNKCAYTPDLRPESERQASANSNRVRATRASVTAAINASTTLLPSDLLVNVDQSDDDVEAVAEAPPAQEQTVVNLAEGANTEAPSHNSPAGAISLEEEVVEIDATDEPDNPLPADAETETTHPHINNEGNAVATNSDENTETSQQQSPFHGVKRKRETDENAEPYSVQEFNQSLLRLLECPVCLEWMEPPISQCRRGHLVCSRCRTRLASCPVCRTTFSSVRNRAMEGVAEMLRYPCRHGCGREVRLRRRGPHEASCGARRYHCPAPPCARHPPLAHHEIAHHFQCKHLPILKIGRKHKFSMKVNSEQHDTWLIMALDEYFHLRVDVDIRTWGVIVYVAYIGPKRKAKHYTYEVTVEGQHNSRSLKYARATHSDLESSSLNVSRQDCFHLTLDQALNFLRFKNRHCEPDKFLDFDVEIDKCPSANAHESKDESDS